MLACQFCAAKFLLGSSVLLEFVHCVTVLIVSPSGGALIMPASTIGLDSSNLEVSARSLLLPRLYLSALVFIALSICLILPVFQLRHREVLSEERRVDPGRAMFRRIVRRSYLRRS